MKAINPQKVKRIVVRVTNWIGDAVMNIPALGAIRATFPDAEIVVVANPMVAELFSPHPYCDRVVVYDKKGAHRGVVGLLRFAAELRRQRFDAAILLQKAVEAAIMTFLARIPIRLGYGTDGRALLLTHRLPLKDADLQQHQSGYYLHLLRRFGIEGGDGKQFLHCTEEEKRWAEAVLGNDSWLAINPGAAYGSAKRWIPERFAGVGDRLAEKYSFRLLLTGGPGEMEIGRDIAAAMKNTPLNLIGQTSVRQMMALLSRCRLVITNDSGPMHVAAALGVPIVAIFGPTDHTTTFPAGVAHRIVRKEVECAPCLLRQCPTDHRCMDMVSVDDVMRAATEILHTCHAGSVK